MKISLNVSALTYTCMKNLNRDNQYVFWERKAAANPIM